MRRNALVSLHPSAAFAFLVYSLLFSTLRHAIAAWVSHRELGRYTPSRPFFSKCSHYLLTSTLVAFLPRDSPIRES
jgi:hypothetical protein